MTLDEAIKIYEMGAKRTWNGRLTIYAEQCQQMAEWLKDYKRLLEQQPCEISQGLVKDSQGFSQEPCEDCISRQKVLDVIDAYKYLDGNDAIYRLKQWLNEQEPVQPKMGRWISVNPMVDTLMCSECGENIISEEFKSNYCPNCGCKMQEVDE